MGRGAGRPPADGKQPGGTIEQPGGMQVQVQEQAGGILHKFKIVSSIRSSYQGKPALAIFINFWSSSLPIQKR